MSADRCIQALIASKFKDQVSLYHDNGIAVCKSTPKEIEKIKQEVGNILIVNFLDITFNLTNGQYKPYMKPNNKLLYVHQQSNHPSALLKNIPENINKRLTNNISSSKEEFNEAASLYQKATEES